VVEELIDAGHTVVGLARSAQGTAALVVAGSQNIFGSQSGTATGVDAIKIRR
jgi:hypothetical protein